MSSPDSAIRTALSTRLKSLPGLPQHPQGLALNGWAEAVVWENKQFTPPTALPYLAPNLITGKPIQAEVGEAGRNLHVGIYQISIFSPAKAGVLSMNTLRDGIIDHFKRGTILTSGLVNLTIQKAYAGPMMQEPDWAQLPITVEYKLFAAN